MINPRTLATAMRLVGVIFVFVGLALVIVYWPHGFSRPASQIDWVPASLTAEPGPRPSDTPVVSAVLAAPTPSRTSTVAVTATPTLTPSSTSTSTPSPSSTSTAANTPMPILAYTATFVPQLTRTPAVTTGNAANPIPKVFMPLWQGRARFGVGVPIGLVTHYTIDQIGIGWYLNWGTSPNPARPGGVEYAQMIRTPHGALVPDAATIATIARAVPGSLWLVGNEPDRAIWQDDATPVQYVAAYHQAYTVIKQADSTALVAVAGVIQPTPLRLRYLDAILAAYQQLYGTTMPVDVWNVHNFILREERGNWGAEIPPGLPDHQGILVEPEDHDNLEMFKAQIWAFRRWMRDRGQQNKPLIVSEYGILMPPDYGFDPERVSRFLIGTFDFFLSASDPALGYPPDGNRLVQRWCWYSLSDTEYPAGNLFAPNTFQKTLIGQAWHDYASRK